MRVQEVSAVTLGYFPLNLLTEFDLVAFSPQTDKLKIDDETPSGF